MPDARRRHRAVLVAALATALLIGQVPSVAVAKDPPGLDRFLRALGHVESGGRYDARNAHSGAYGKYQIMPTSWHAWARRYLGNANARQTPHNQEVVASHKVTALFDWLRDWRFVAHWWLTGSSSTRPAAWSAYSRRYVARVIHYYKVGVSSGRFVDDSAGAIDWSAGWKTARYGRYEGGRAHYSSRPGAETTYTFTGRSISWIGPVGPTRGRAEVSIDGRPVRTVDLHRSSFRSGVALFTRTWATSGRHTITITVVGRSGRPVAVEGFRVRG